MVPTLSIWREGSSLGILKQIFLRLHGSVAFHMVISCVRQTPELCHLADLGLYSMATRDLGYMSHKYYVMGLPWHSVIQPSLNCLELYLLNVIMGLLHKLSLITLLLQDLSHCAQLYHLSPRDCHEATLQCCHVPTSKAQQLYAPMTHLCAPHMVASTGRWWPSHWPNVVQN